MIEFKGSHFEREVILWGIRWYVAYPISYRQLEEMLEERGVEVYHSMPNRLGCQIRTAAGSKISRPQAPGRRQLAIGRDICEGQRQLEIFVSGRRGWCHGGLPVDGPKRDRKAAYGSYAKAIGQHAVKEDHDRQDRRQHGGHRELQRRT